MRKLLSILLLGLLIFVVSGCEEEKVYETEYFTYKIRDQRIAILYLTDLGKEQKTLVIPSEMNGIVVGSLGIPFNTLSKVEGYFSSTNLERLYFEGNPFISMYFFDLPQLKYAFCLMGICPKEIQVDGELIPSSYRTLYYPYFFKLDDESTPIANVTYFLNLQDDLATDLYYIDHYENQTIQYKPKDPFRSSRVFLGWFKDKEGLEPWNFESDIVPFGETQTQINLYAKWA